MNKLTKTHTNTLDIGIPGVFVKRNALIFSDDVSREGFSDAGKFLGSVEGSRMWWIADYVLAGRRYRGEHYGAAEFALEMGIEEQSVRNAVAVGKLFAPEYRFEELSFTHHQEAYNGAGGDVEVAKSWLEKAVKNKWSTTKLREQIRLSADNKTTENEETPSDGGEESSAGDPGPARGAAGFSELKKANTWARERIDEGWRPDERTARAVLDSMDEILALAKKLRGIVGVDEEEAA